jgi:hypothetical protein
MKNNNKILGIVGAAALVLVLLVPTTMTTTSTYAQLEEDTPFVVDHVPLSNRISAMEENDDIDIEAIDQRVREALDIIPRLQGSIIAHQELLVLGHMSDLDRLLWEIRFEIASALPASELEITGGDPGVDIEAYQELAQQVSEFDPNWRIAVNEPRIGTLPAGDGTLNVRAIDMAVSQGMVDIGRIAGQAIATPLYGGGYSPTSPPSETANTLKDMSDQFLNIRDELVFNVPIEEARVVGTVVDTIDQLRARQLQFGD